MPRLTTPTTTLIRRAPRLPATSPSRHAWRMELAAIRAMCPTVAALCKALGRGERHARRLLADYDLPRYTRPRSDDAPSTTRDGKVKRCPVDAYERALARLAMAPSPREATDV